MLLPIQVQHFLSASSRTYTAYLVLGNQRKAATFHIDYSCQLERDSHHT